MTNHELFGGRCPYTDEVCGLTIECVNCSVEREEKESMARLDRVDGDVPDTNVGKLDGDPIDIDKAVEHYEGTLETLKGIDLEVNA